MDDCETHPNYVRPIPPEPTTALPGTDEKIRVMQERWSLGYSLHHPNDIHLTPNSIERATGMTHLVGIFAVLEQMRLRGVK